MQSGGSVQRAAGTDQRIGAVAQDAEVVGGRAPGAEEGLLGVEDAHADVLPPGVDACRRTLNRPRRTRRHRGSRKWSGAIDSASSLTLPRSMTIRIWFVSIGLSLVLVERELEIIVVG